MSATEAPVADDLQGKTAEQLRDALLARLKKQNDEDAVKHRTEFIDAAMKAFDTREAAWRKTLSEQFPQHSVPGAPDVGEDKDQFCIGRASHGIHSGDWGHAGLEKEVFDNVRKSTTTTNDPTGSWVLPTQISEKIIQPLRKSVIAFKLGMREETNEGFVGFQMRRLVSDLTNASWNAELVPATPGDIGLGNIELRPRTLVAAHESSKLAMRASPGMVHNMVINSAKEQLRRKIDFAAFQGSGQGNEPLGIINIDFVNTATFALDGTGDLDEILDFMHEVRKKDGLNDANSETTGWALNADKFNKLLKIKDDSNQPTERRVISTGPDAMLRGYKYAHTTSLPTTAGSAIFGDWGTSFFLGFGGGIEIDVETGGRTNALAGQVTIVLTQHGDIAFEQPLAFVVSTN